MIKFNNRILMMTTMLLTFSFMTKANAQTFISGESGGGESTITTTCEMPPSCESLGYNKTAEDCANKVTLKCPMDESKLYCADAKQNGVCSEGYSEIEKIIPYCTGDNARLVYDTLNPNCAKCLAKMLMAVQEVMIIWALKDTAQKMLTVVGLAQNVEANIL